ncbi:MAG: TatD family hydrolase [Clostridiaceae bacterium]|jgi:TatD DNase family protein|nr:TatD family hydrolase [Clostridiaceae bacterium]
MQWFDSHAHLQDRAFASDLDAVLARALAAGVTRIILPASDHIDSQRALSLAGRYRGQENGSGGAIRLWTSIGCHPHEASKYGPDGTERLRRMITPESRPLIVAIGETGLDYHYDHSPRHVQREVFRQQLDLAYALDLPLIIHEREATADCLKILRQQADAGRLHESPGVFHCFSGSPETAAVVRKMGFFIGIDGPVTYKNARKTLDVVRQCSTDRLLLETDSPYLTPVPKRGQRNEPANLPLIGQKVAELWGMTQTEVARLTFDNACRAFRLADID